MQKRKEMEDLGKRLDGKTFGITCSSTHAILQGGRLVVNITSSHAHYRGAKLRSCSRLDRFVE